MTVENWSTYFGGGITVQDAALDPLEEIAKNFISSSSQQIVTQAFCSVADLVGLEGSVDGQSIFVASYYSTLSYLPGQSGGSLFVWKSTLARSNHDGIHTISPTVSWDGTQSTLSAFHAKTGETNPSGLGCWVRQIERVSVMMAGAVGGAGSTNDTIAINNALTCVGALGGGELFFPDGVYKYEGGGVITNGVVVVGAGRNATFIRSSLASPTDGYLFWASGFAAGLRSLRIDKSTTQTGGMYVWLSGAQSFIDDFWMDGQYQGILMSGSKSRIRHGAMTNGATGSVGIRSEGGDNSQVIDDVILGSQSSQVGLCGLRVRNSKALIVSNTSIIKQGTCVLVDPSTSTSGSATVDTEKGNVSSLKMHNCFFDQPIDYAIKIAPTGNASVNRVSVTDSWASSAAVDGVLIDQSGSTGAVAGLNFTDMHCILNGGSGLKTLGTISDLRIAGGGYSQNAVDGLTLDGTITGLTVTSAVLGQGTNSNGNTGYGLKILGAASDYITVTGNTVRGNTGGTISNASTGTRQFIKNNPGSTYELLSGNLDLTIYGTAGQIKFPSAQNVSSDANTLDDYEEGGFTPAITFETAGDLAVTYTSQTGKYTKIGRQVSVRFQILTSAFTHTTASGNFRITGLPFTTANDFPAAGALEITGYTKANYTSAVLRPATNGTYCEVAVSGSGQTSTLLAVGDVPTGGTIVLRGTLTYFV